MSASPRTAREALFAEILGDLDSMLTRIENLPKLVENCEERLSTKAAALESAGEKYGQAVSAFTEQAKEELTEFLERESASAIEKQSISATLITNKASFSEAENIRQYFIILCLLTSGITALLAALFTFFLLRLA